MCSMIILIVVYIYEHNVCTGTLYPAWTCVMNVDLSVVSNCRVWLLGNSLVLSVSVSHSCVKAGKF